MDIFSSSFWNLGTRDWTIFVSVSILVVFLLVNVYQKHSVNSNQDVFVGRVALVTGASSGIGEAIATELYRHGCHMILHGRRIKELLRVKEKLIGGTPKHLVGIVKEPLLFVKDLQDIHTLEDDLDAFCRSNDVDIDILVNNAGCSYRGLALSTQLNVYERLMNINFYSHVAATKAVVDKMSKKKSPAYIIGVNSIQGKMAIPFRSAYNASKHALSAYYDSLRSELYDSNIKVIVVYPSYVKTNLSINAITQTGELHGVMDHTTASGMPPEYVAQKIYQCMSDNVEEILLSPLTHKLALVCRVLLPSVYFKIMKYRARKQNS